MLHFIGSLHLNSIKLIKSFENQTKINLKIKLLKAERDCLSKLGIPKYAQHA